MARTLLATLPAAALALRATRTTVSMHTNIFPTFTIKDKAAAPGQRRRRGHASGSGRRCWPSGYARRGKMKGLLPAWRRRDDVE